MQKAIVPVSFAGGLDGKTDPKQVLPTKLLALQNGVFRQAGAVSKRWGYTAFSRNVLGSAASIVSCFALQAFNSELLLFDGQAAYSYSPTRDAWLNRGQVVSIIQSNTGIVRNASQQLSPDYATSGGIDVYAWEDSRGGIRYSVLDQATGTFLLVDQPLYVGIPSGAYRPKCLAFGGKVIVLFVNPSQQIAYVQINPLNPTAVAISAVTIETTASSTPVFYDATVSGSQLLIAYTINAGVPSTGSINLCAFTMALQVAWTVTVATPSTVANAGLSVVGDAAGNGWVTYGDGGNPSLSCATSVYSSAGSLTLAPTRTVSQTTGGVQAVTGIVASAGTLTLFVEAAGADPTREVLYSNTVTTAGALGTPAASAPVLVRSVGLASKAFTFGGAVYLNVAYQSALQSTYFTIDSVGRVVSKALPGLGGGLIANSDFMLPECPTIASGIFVYPNLVKGIPNTEAGQVESLLGVNATKLDFSDSNHFLSAAINGGFYTVGGILQSYDGTRYVEHGFHIYPETFVATPIGSGGALGTGTYNYVVTYEWPDNNGFRQVSTISIPVAVTFGGGTTNSVQLTIPTLRLTKKSRVQIVVYRTAANGVTLTRVTSAVLPLYNDPTVDTVTFVDVLSDASIAGNGALRTQPLAQGSQVLDNVAPPSSSIITTYADRIWLAGTDNPFLLWYSQQTTKNVPMEFAAELTFQTDPDGGAITALARLDEKLVIFKETGIFYLIGQGPTATGDQNDLNDPISIPSGGIGCVNAGAVVLTPLGLMFPSANGIYLLDRNLNVSYKGAPVEPFNALAITSATVIPNQWVVFTTTSGTALVYDYYYDQWSTFTNHSAIDACLYLGNGDLFAFAQPDGHVFQQSPTLFSDAGVPIPLSLTTAWINPAAAGGSLQGYQRLYHAFVLGQRKGSHTLNVWVGFDYDDAFTALAAIPVDATLGISTFGSSSPFGTDPIFGGAGQGTSVYQFRVDVLRKCQAFRFQISDVDTGNEALSLSALSLVVGVKTGGNKVAAIKQFGAL